MTLVMLKCRCQLDQAHYLLSVHHRFHLCEHFPDRPWCSCSGACAIKTYADGMNMVALIG